MELLLIDGNSIANRSFYGIRPLSNKKGVFTQATTGFFNTYLRLLKLYGPKAVAVAFDLRAPTFRKELYDGYKATRKGMPDELAMQMPYIKRILSALGIAVLECEGYEADDIIGTLSHAADLAGYSCVIATGDRDSLQLVSDNVTVHLVKTKDDAVYTPTAIREQYGVSPAQMLDIKALQGDVSDNIPGVAGIGEKTALTLVQNYSGIDYIYEHLETISVTPAIYKKLEQGKEMCFLSRKLGEINLCAPVSTAIADYRLKGMDNGLLSQILTELEMFSLMKKLDIKPSAISQEPSTDTKTQELHQTGQYADVLYIDGVLNVLQNDKLRIIPKEKEKEFLQNDAEKRTFDIKSLWSYAYPNNIEIKNVVFDTTIAAYLLNVNAAEYTLERLCGEYGVEYKDDSKAECVRLLNDEMSLRLYGEGMTKVLTDIEIPLSEVLVSMEHYGITLDIDGVKQFGTELEAEIAETEEKIYGLAGTRFNISSPKQLGVVLFERLGLPTGKKTKTGYSTNADILEFLMDKHPIVPLISEYRSLTKLNSTYVTGLLKVVSDDGRIHTTFKQTETRTGRISSAEPNIQNIPVRTPRGKIMRKFFAATPSKVLVDADYSQIELRVLAAMSGDKIMQNAFINGDDIHTITASQVFNQPIEWVTPQMRSAAKAVNFGIVYGIGAFSLSKDIGVSVAEADRYIKNYLGKYHSVQDYMDKIILNAKKNGYVETMFGRRRYIPELMSSNKNIEALGKRIAMNTPIQGTAADIIKIAMVNVYKRLKSEKIPARLVLQVHDELIAECDEKYTKETMHILREEMERAASLSVPVTVDINSGSTWFDTH